MEIRRGFILVIAIVSVYTLAWGQAFELGWNQRRITDSGNRSLVNLDGTLGLRCVSDSGTGMFHIVQVLYTSSRTYQLITNNRELGTRPSGSAHVVGYCDGDVVNVSSFNLSRVTSRSVVKINPSTRTRVLILLWRFLDSQVRTFGPTEVYAKHLGPDASSRKFYQENSYGKFSLEGQVFGWFTIPATNGTFNDSSSSYYSGFMDRQIEQLPIDLHDFDCRIDVYDLPLGAGYGVKSAGVGKMTQNYKGSEVHISQITFPLCFGDSAAYMRPPGDWDIDPPTMMFDKAFVHELGHTLGLDHACSYRGDLDTVFLPGYPQYPNPYDGMGQNFSYAYHFNSYMKEQLGWLDSSSILTIDSSGEYTINALEYSSGYRAACILPKGTQTQKFFLEYRVPHGFDSTLSSYSYQNGLMLNINPQYLGLPIGVIYDEFGYAIGPSYLISTYGQGEFGPPPWGILQPGGLYVDSAHGLTIGPITSLGQSRITFRVQFYPSTQLAEPVLLAPLTDISLPTPSARFVWSKIPGAIAYHLQLGYNVLSPKLDITGIADTSISLQDLPTTYLGNSLVWRVQGIGQDKVGQWGTSRFWIYLSLPEGMPNTQATLPAAVELLQNYPNPFNPTTTIRYGLPRRSQITLSVYNTLGQLVRNLVNGTEAAGYHDVKFDGTSLASGVYFFRIQSENFIKANKFLLIR